MNWLALISGAIGILLGATLQYWYGQRAETQRHRRERRADAYAECLEAIGAAAHKLSDGDLLVARRRFAVAKARIVVYGSTDVLRALAKFEMVGANTGTHEGAAAIIDLCQAMRRESRSDGHVTKDELGMILMGESSNGRDLISPRID